MHETARYVYNRQFARLSGLRPQHLLLLIGVKVKNMKINSRLCGAKFPLKYH